MSWIDQLSKASFRGVPFHMPGGKLKSGRQIDRHFFPGGEKPFNEDLGAKGRKYPVTAFLIGDDYLQLTQNLIDALEKKGPGRLVHTYLGAFNAEVDDFEVSYSDKHGGMATLTIEFLPEGKKPNPTVKADTSAKVASSADGALEAVQKVFKNRFNASSKPAFVAESGKDLVNGAMDRLDQTTRLISSAGDPLTNFNRTLKQGRASVSDLVRAPGDLASQLVDLYQSVVNLSDSPDQIIRVLRQLASFGNDLPSVPGATPSRFQQAANQSAMVNLVGDIALIEEARATAKLPFATYNDAIATRDDLSSRLVEATDKAGENGDDDLWRSFRQLNSDVIEDISIRGADLVTLGSHTPSTTQSSLLIAHKLYGADLSQVETRAAEIVTRNKVFKPGFIDGGRELEVLRS